MFTQDYSTPTFPKVEVEDEVCVTLRRAADEIRKRGHVKWELCDEGRVCVRGAITAVIVGKSAFNAKSLTELYGLQDARYLAFSAADDELSQYLGDRSTVDWNNAIERTASEVIEALEGAALTRARALAGRK